MSVRYAYWGKSSLLSITFTREGKAELRGCDATNIAELMESIEGPISHEFLLASFVWDLVRRVDALEAGE